MHLRILSFADTEKKERQRKHLDSTVCSVRCIRRQQEADQQPMQPNAENI